MRPLAASWTAARWIRRGGRCNGTAVPVCPAHRPRRLHRRAARSRPRWRRHRRPYQVRYDGKQLVFPGWTEIKPLEQARRNADWLRKWLSSAVGVPIEVKPVLMLPGWYVERTSPPRIPVMNGTNCRNFFLKAREQPLSDQLIRQIVHQLDARCRDVEPRSFRPSKD